MGRISNIVGSSSNTHNFPLAGDSCATQLGASLNMLPLTWNGRSEIS